MLYVQHCWATIFQQYCWAWKLLSGHEYGDNTDLPSINAGSTPIDQIFCKYRCFTCSSSLLAYSERGIENYTQKTFIFSTTLLYISQSDSFGLWFDVTWKPSIDKITITLLCSDFLLVLLKIICSKTKLKWLWKHFIVIWATLTCLFRLVNKVLQQWWLNSVVTTLLSWLNNIVDNIVHAGQLNIVQACWPCCAFFSTLCYV